MQPILGLSKWYEYETVGLDMLWSHVFLSVALSTLSIRNCLVVYWYLQFSNNSNWSVVQQLLQKFVLLQLVLVQWQLCYAYVCPLRVHSWMKAPASMVFCSWFLDDFICMALLRIDNRFFYGCTCIIALLFYSSFFLHYSSLFTAAGYSTHPRYVVSFFLYNISRETSIAPQFGFSTAD